MVNINITRMSSKGQVVIPSYMRDDLKEGDELLIFKDEGMWILKKADEVSEQMKEEFEFARRTEEALKRYDKGEFIELDGEEFLKELDEW